MADFLAFIGGGNGNVALAERKHLLVAELGSTGISQELRVLLDQPDLQNWLRRLPLPAETGAKLDEILGRISDDDVFPLSYRAHRVQGQAARYDRRRSRCEASASGARALQRLPNHLS